jgi:hypothetical protein
MPYLYQCADCGCTLYGDSKEGHESYTYMMTGEVCNSCQLQRDYDYDDDNDD